MSHDFERHTVSFVIRLWQEPLAGKDTVQWRGQIEHVPSGEQSYFQISNSLWEFLAHHLPGQSMMNSSPTARPPSENMDPQMTRDGASEHDVSQ